MYTVRTCSVLLYVPIGLLTEAKSPHLINSQSLWLQFEMACSEQYFPVSGGSRYIPSGGRGRGRGDTGSSDPFTGTVCVCSFVPTAMSLSF